MAKQNTQTIQTQQWQLQARPNTQGTHSLYWVVRGTNSGFPVQNACCLPQYDNADNAIKAALAWGYDEDTLIVDQTITTLLTPA